MAHLIMLAQLAQHQLKCSMMIDYNLEESWEIGTRHKSCSESGTAPNQT